MNNLTKSGRRSKTYSRVGDLLLSKTGAIVNPVFSNILHVSRDLSHSVKPENRM